MKFAWGFLLGAFTGAAVAMIAAPQSGDEVRDVLYARSRETSGRVVDAAEDLAEDAKIFSSEVQTNVGEMIERGKAFIEVARSALDQAVDEGRRAANEQRESLESQSR